MKKYFGTDGIRGEIGTPPISADWVLKLGWAVGCVISEKLSPKKPTVLIGKDTRVSGYLLESALEAGLSSAGVDILLCGPIPTPAIAFLTRSLKASLGIVISASHNPFQDNGLKFFDAKGHKFDDDFELLVEAQLEKPFSTVKAENLGKATRLRDAEKRYIDFCQNTIPSTLSLKGLIIVLDCANGATYRVAPILFRLLEAYVIEMHTEPDGFNINVDCGSTHPCSLVKRVKEAEADLGIAFDGDGDRVLMIDSHGNILDGDDVLFIIAKWYAQHHRLKGGVVGTLMSNYALEKAIKELGVEFVRSAVGDHFVLEKIQEKGWNIGGESSGHIICLDKSTTGDGIIAALQVLNAMVSLKTSLFELRKSMVKYPQCLMNILIEQKTNNGENNLNRNAILEKPIIKAAIQETEAKLNNRGRVLVRLSGTEPVIRVLVEGEEESMVKELAEQLAHTIKENLFT